MSVRPDSSLHILPCGGALWLDRPRSDGPLTQRELASCRSADIPLAFDPVQSGWVSATVDDDLAINNMIDVANPNPAPQLTFRAWAQSDVARYVSLLDDPAVWALMPEPYPNPLDRDLAADLIELSNASNHHQVHAVLSDGEPIGQVRLEFECDPHDPSVAEISYWFGRPYWGRGLASTAVRAFARQSLAEHPGLSALVAKVKTGNAASRRVLEKAGFVADGDDTLIGWDRFRKAR